MRYAVAVSVLAATESFDVIHAHDWMTVFAAVHARRMSGKPVIFHVHSLEYDRSGESVDPVICDIERLGMEEADHIIAVSSYTKERIVKPVQRSCGQDILVHNAISSKEAAERCHVKKPLAKNGLFWQVTFQKGRSIFWKRGKTHPVDPLHQFVMAGSGDFSRG